MNATPNPAIRGRRVPGEEALHVTFSTEAVESTLKSQEEGRPVYDDVDFVEIRIPGDAFVIIKEIAREEYQLRFPDEWAAFKANKTTAETGTPLEHFSLLTPSQVASLKHQNIRTVEALASVSDANLNSIMGGHSIRAKAQTWLKAATDAAALEKQEEQLAELRAQVATLKTKIK